MAQIKADSRIPQRTELEVLIHNLEQTKDPIKEIEAQVEFITNELKEDRLTLGEYIHRFTLFSQAEKHFREG